MKHLKVFEAYKNYKWNNIYQKGDKLYIHVYNLSHEMLDTLGKNPDDRFDQDVHNLENEYCELIEELLEGKVITFSCSDCSVNHTGVCEYIYFESGFQPAENGFFEAEYLQIKLEESSETHNIDDDKIIVHLDGDPELYRNINKYNI